MSKTVNVILSGGIGSRLWPLSRKSRPKQYLPLFGGKTLFQLCVERNRSLCDQQVIVGNAQNYRLTLKDMSQLAINDYTCIVEAVPRNTAAAIAFAAFSTNQDDILLVTPSDHVVRGTIAYQQAVSKAFDLAAAGALVTFGVEPTKAETGYGYLETEGNNVISFREKPDEQTARAFVESGDFLWNSGIFCFKANIYLQALQQYEPDIYHTALAAWTNKEYQFLPEAESMLIPSKSVDYAVMERAEHIKVVQADFEWNDLGSFDAIWDYKESQKFEGFSNNNMAMATSGKHIEFLGVENLILVETADAILVMPRNHSQQVKAVYDRLETERPELLK